MKKVLILALAIAGLSTAGLAQTKAPAKVNEAPKMKVVSKTETTKTGTKVVAMHKVEKKARPATHEIAKKPVIIKSTATTVKKETSTKVPMLKKDGTPDKRFKNHTAAVSTPLKKDGTPDKRFKSNKPVVKH